MPAVCLWLMEMAQTDNRTEVAQEVDCRLLILGSGPAGCTAAIYASRANLAPLLISGEEPGGQLTTTTEVENWPAGVPGLQGPQLMDAMRDHAGRFGAELRCDHIVTADLSRRPFLLRGERDSYRCEALIIATGASAKYLGLESERRYLGRGVSACATCDGFFFRGQDVLVIGGGNTAAEECLYLCKLARRVILVHRRGELRAERILQQRLFELERAGKLSIRWHHVLEEVCGDDSGVTGVKLRDLSSGQLREEPMNGVFIAIGHQPNTALFDAQLDMDGGYLRTVGGGTATSIPGVFAAGDVSDPVYRQAVTAAGLGCMAALDAERFLDAPSS